jgi:aldose 1-epimerase
MDGLTDGLALGAAGGVRATVLPYGATIAGLHVPNRAGVFQNVVLTAPDYKQRHPYFGCVVGRYANRIARGRFPLNGKVFQLSCNDGLNALHGGPGGFSRRLWRVAQWDGQTAVLTYRAAAGEEGYPGAVSVDVAYTVDGHDLRIDYRAESDADTVINLTNHSYFNLKGKDTILHHELLISSDSYTPIDSGLIPTGEVAPTSGTPFDFRSQREIGAHILDRHPQITFAGGYDHNFALAGGVTQAPRFAALLYEPTTGRRLTILTTEPGLQVYAGTQLDGAFGYPRFGGIALETQHFPDSPNHPNFPSTLLRAGEAYRSTTIWRFDTL